jgi:hypothetical protein
MGRSGRAAVAGMEGGQVLAVDLPQVPRQDSGCNTHALEHRTGQSRVGFLTQVDSSPSSAYLLVSLALLSASPDVGTVEGSGIQSKEDRGLDLWVK